MSEQQTSPAANPWMRPMSAQLLVRKDAPARVAEPVGPYTPNEPDENEAVYAARAAAARQQAEARQRDASLSPVQMAVEQAAQEAHAARQTVAEPAQPDAVLYQQSTGVQQPEEEPEQPVQPTQPHRLPTSAYAIAQMDARPISRQADEAALADPMLVEEARQTTAPRRRRMVMRQEREAAEAAQAVPPEAQQEAAPEETQAPAEEPGKTEEAAIDNSVYEDLFEAEEPVENEAEPPASPQESGPADGQPEGEAPHQPGAAENDPADAPAEAGEDLACDLTLSQLDPAHPSEEYFRMPLENPLKGYAWYTDEVLDEEDDPEEDCMDTSAMPVPAPVSTIDVPRMRRGKWVLSLLLSLMLLLAAGGYLWISGHGEVLYRKALQLVETLKAPTVRTGAMTVSPETAAPPAVLTVTLTTGSDISAIELMDDADQPLAAEIVSRAQGEDTLWTCTLRMDAAYVGFVRARCLCSDGLWRVASQKRHVDVN